MKRLYVATLLCLLVLFGQLVAAPSFSTLVSDARHGSLTESDLSDLLGTIPSHQIDALREIINNPNAYTNIDESRPLRAYTTAGNTLEGELLSEFGFVIVNAGNVTNEAVAAAGHEAILVGAPYYDNSRGRVYLYLGGGVGEAGGVNAPINDAFDSIADKIWEGESEGDLFGATLGENFNLDAAGTTDILIGAYKYGMNETGKVYLIGGDAGWTHATAAPAADRMTATAAGLADLDVTITGSNDYEYFGSSFALVDNFDATGAGNYHLAVGAYRYSSSGDPVPEDYRGRVYLFQDAAVTGDIVAETAAEFIINGRNEGDRFGFSMADAGRFIGDLAAGQDALLVGAYGADNYKGYVNALTLGDAAGFTATDLDIVKVLGNYAYVANNAAGAQELAIFDISDQTNPILTDTYAVGAAEDITFIEVKSDGNSLVFGHDDQIRTLDITDKYAVTSVSTEDGVGDMVGPWVGAAIVGDYIVVLQATDLMSFEIADVDNGVIGQIQIDAISANKTGTAVAASGSNHVYFATNDTDASDEPTLLYAYVTAAGALEDGSATNNTADVNDALSLTDQADNILVGNGVAYLEMAATANASNASIVATTSFGSPAVQYAVVAEGGILRTYNVDDATNVVFLDEIGVGGTIGAVDFNANGDIAFVAYSNADGDFVAAYSLFNPSNITLLDASNDLGFGGANNIVAGAVNGNFFVGTAVFATGTTNRIFSVDISDPYAIDGLADSEDALGAPADLKVDSSNNILWIETTNLRKTTMNATTGVISAVVTTEAIGGNGSAMSVLGDVAYVASDNGGGEVVPIVISTMTAAAAGATNAAITAIFVHQDGASTADVFAAQAGEIESYPIADTATGALGVINTVGTNGTLNAVAGFANFGLSSDLFAVSEDGLSAWEAASVAPDLPAADSTTDPEVMAVVTLASPSNLDGNLADTDAAEGFGGARIEGIEIPEQAQRGTYTAFLGWGLAGNSLYVGSTIGGTGIVKGFDVSNPQQITRLTDSAAVAGLLAIDMNATNIVVTATAGVGQMTVANPPVYVAGSGTLTSITHQIIEGESAGDYFGWSMANAALDIDQAGEADLAIGAPFAGGGRGKVYVMYQQNRADLPAAVGTGASWTTAEGMILTGSNVGDNIGHAVKLGNVGDADGGVDGDGEYDLIVSSVNENSDAGKVYIAFNAGLKGGSATEIELSTLCDANSEGQMLEGENTNDQFGKAVAVGDFRNFQGTDDVAIAAPNFNRSANDGKVYLYTNGILADFSATPLSTDINNNVAFTPAVSIFPNNVGTVTTGSYDWEVDDTSAGDEATNVADPGSYTHTYTSSGTYDAKLELEATVAGFNGGAATDTDNTKVDYIEILPVLTAEAYYYHAPTDLPGVYSSTPLANGDSVEIGGIIKYVATLGTARAAGDTLDWNVASTVSNDPAVTVQYTRPEVTADVEYYWTLGTNSSVVTAHTNNNGGHGNGKIKSALGESLTLTFEYGSPITLNLGSTYNPPNIDFAAGDLTIYTDSGYSSLLATSAVSPTVVPTQTSPLYIQMIQTDGYGYGPYTLRAKIIDDADDTVLGYVDLTQLAQPNENSFRGAWDITGMSISTPTTIRVEPELDADTSAKVLWYSSDNLVTGASFTNAAGTAYAASEQEDTLKDELYISVSGTLPANPYVYLSSQTIDNNGVLIPITGALTQVQIGVASSATSSPKTIGYKVGEALYIRNLSVAAGAPPATTLDQITVAAETPTLGFGLWAPADNSIGVDVNPPLKWNKFDGTQHDNTRGAVDQVTYYMIYVGTGSTLANARDNLITKCNFSATPAAAVDGVTGYKGQPSKITTELSAYLDVDLPKDSYVVWNVLAISGANDAFAHGDPEAGAGNLDYSGGVDASAGDFAIVGNLIADAYSFKTFTDDEANGQYFPFIQGSIDHDRTFNANNTYYLDDNPTVDAGVTLTIPAGTTLKFADGETFTINGNLVTQGTDASRVVLTKYDAATSWQGVVFPSGVSPARTALTVDTDYSYLTGSKIHGVTFLNSVAPITTAEAIHIADNVIASTNTGGIVDTSNGSYIISNTINGITGNAVNGGLYILNNVIEDCGGYAITGATGSTVSGNTIRNNGAHAIWNASVIDNNNVMNHNITETLIKSTACTSFRNNGTGAEAGISNNVVTGDSLMIADITITAGSAVKFDGNKFVDNQADYIVKATVTQVNMDDNYFEDNVGGKSDGAAIWLSASGTSTANRNRIISTTGNQLTGGAMYIDAATALTVDGGEFALNQIYNGNNSKGAGVYVNAGTVTLSNNVISYNTASEYPGVYINAGALVTLTSNYINQNSVYSSSRATGTNYAVYGDPVDMDNNYLWMNSSAVDLTASIPAIANWDTEYPLSGASYEFRYTGTSTLVASNNCFGSRNDLGYIDPTIYDDNEDIATGSPVGIGMVEYQPFNTVLPVTVEEVHNLAMVGDGFMADGGRFVITQDCIGMASFGATRSNAKEYSQDIASLTVENISSNTRGGSSEIISFETGRNSNEYAGFFVVSSTYSDYDRGVIQANIGDIIRVSSTDYPNTYMDVEVVEARFDMPETVTIQEDESYEINPGSNALVPYGRSFGLTVEGGENIRYTLDANMNMVFTPVENWFGSETFTFTLRSADGILDLTDQMTIIVSEVNDKPLASTPFELFSANSLPEDFEEKEVNLASFFTDAEGDAISYVVEANEEQVKVRVEGDKLYVSSVENFNTGVSGATKLVIKASDGVSREETVVDYNLNIYPVNDAPVIVSETISAKHKGDDIMLDSNEALTIDVVAEDVDSEISYNWKVTRIDNYDVLANVQNAHFEHSFDEKGIYQVQLTVSDGEFNVTETKIAYVGVPAASAVLGNYPNPFNPSTTVSLYLKEASDVSVDIFNVKGQKVRSFKAKDMPIGYHTFEWNGKNRTGQTVSTGVYFYRVKAKGLKVQRKMLMVK